MCLRLWYGNSPIEATATTEMPEVQQVTKGFLAGVSSYVFQPIPSAKQTNKWFLKTQHFAMTEMW